MDTEFGAFTSVFSFFFFFFFGKRACGYYEFSVGPVHYLRDPKTSLFNNFFIKNGSHNIIYTFKNYFITIFSVFSNILEMIRVQMILLFVFIYEKTMYIVKHTLILKNFCLRWRKLIKIFFFFQIMMRQLI